MYRRAVNGLIAYCLAYSPINAQPVAPKIDASQAASQGTMVTLSQPTYDVSTFRESKSDENKSVYTHFDTLGATNWPLIEMLQEAFDIQQELIIGLPGWAQKAHYVVNAKVTEADMARLKKLTPEQWNGMLRSLCEQRLGLKWHFEIRPELVYELVVAKGGSKLQAAVGPASDVGISVENSNVIAKHMPTAALAKLLSKTLERPVVDQT